MQGYFITFEGPDGAGKTTVINEVVKAIQGQCKREILVTREPGGSKIAEKIRDIILDPANTEMNAKTEALLYAASRSQHVSEIINPALKRGDLVMSDRFVDSSLAYQGQGRGLGIDEVAQINAFATGLQIPPTPARGIRHPPAGLSPTQARRPKPSLRPAGLPPRTNRPPKAGTARSRRRCV